MKSQSPASVCRLGLIALLFTALLRTYGASPSDQAQLASANTGFAFSLLKEITKEQPARNVFISPYSVSSVLQMVCNGAGGKTREELRQVLGTTGMTMSAVNRASLSLSQAVQAGSSNVILSSANAIWYRKGISVRPEFIACNEDFYKAQVEGLDFNDPASVGIMNGWVSEVTRGRIPNIVAGPINPETDLYLLNAIAFKGLWFIPFETKNTKARVFHLRGGGQQLLPMMTRTDKFFYRRGTGYQALVLGYKGWNLTMYVFLPDADSSPEKLLANMNGGDWQRTTLPGFRERKGTLALPRFKLEYAADLKKPLRALGLRHAFEGADFSGVSSVRLFVGEAVHKTFVEVTEEGSEAAGATMMYQTKGIEENPPKPFEMVVDRPFVFVIQHYAADRTSSILFMGVAFDPGAAS